MGVASAHLRPATRDEDQLNPGLHSIQCGRRNEALKVWTSWKYYGQAGYEKKVDRLFELSRYAVELIHRDADFDLIQEPESTTVCFSVSGKSDEHICEILDRQGMIKVGYGSAHGHTFIRLVFVNPDIEEKDVDNFFSKVKEASQQAHDIAKDKISGAA